MSEHSSSSSFFDSPCTKTRKAAERDFDSLIEEDQDRERSIPRIPPFQPVFYDPEEPPRKFRRIAARAHEHDLRDKYMEVGHDEKVARDMALAASYYPGSRYQTLNRALTYSWSPPRICISSSEDEASPRFLFKDLLPTHSRLPGTPKTPLTRLLPGTPRTPRLSASCSSSHMLQQPSPMFDKFVTRRRHGRKALPRICEDEDN